MARRGRRTVLAAIDIGSYSVHLLVGRVSGRRVEPLHDESAFLGLGRTIDREGQLGSARPDLVATLAAFKIAALSRDAAAITVVGTDPLRRAPDAPEAIAEIEAVTGLRSEPISHEEEAVVALLGVTGGRPIDHVTALVDVGGGSTEVLVVAQGSRPQAVGLPLGATRLTGVHVHHDPPTADEMGTMAAVSASAMRSAPQSAPVELVAVGGTARSLLRVGSPISGRTISRRRLERALGILASSASASDAETYSIRPSRAAVLPAGATILQAAIDRYDLDGLRLAKGGLREGLILATAHAGSPWRNHLAELEAGWAA